MAERKKNLNRVKFSKKDNKCNGFHSKNLNAMQCDDREKTIAFYNIKLEKWQQQKLKYTLQDVTYIL